MEEVGCSRDSCDLCWKQKQVARLCGEDWDTGVPVVDVCTMLGEVVSERMMLVCNFAWMRML